LPEELVKDGMGEGRVLPRAKLQEFFGVFLGVSLFNEFLEVAIPEKKKRKLIFKISENSKNVSF
jgi:hypothetical protein